MLCESVYGVFVSLVCVYTYRHAHVHSMYTTASGVSLRLSTFSETAALYG